MCDIVDCEIENCMQRHPRDCYYFQSYKACKFGEYCRYKHDKVADCENVFKVRTELEVEKIGARFESIEKEIKNLKDEVSKLNDENSELKRKIIIFEENTVTKRLEDETEKNEEDKDEINLIDGVRNDLECVECEFKSRTKNGLKIHMSAKHKNISQLDGNVETESESEDLDDLELKVVFIGKDVVSAEAELRKYYIGEIISDYSEDIHFIEN